MKKHVEKKTKRHAPAQPPSPPASEPSASEDRMRHKIYVAASKGVDVVIDLALQLLNTQEPDMKEFAINLLRYAADQGDVRAQHALGSCYAEGNGVPKDPKEMVSWFKKAAQEGYQPAQYNLSVCYEKALGVPKNAQEAIKWLKKAAGVEGGKGTGYAQAQYDLAAYYLKGQGVPRNHQMAIELHRKAAAQHYVPAYYALFVCYKEGVGTSRDEKLAKEWLTKAAINEHVLAQYIFAKYYMLDDAKSFDDLPRIYAQMMRCYHKAANQGHADAQFSVGWHYATGQGEKRDDSQAVEWFKKAAEQGHAQAQFHLAWHYANGQGAPRDLWIAADWCAKAADQSRHPGAQRAAKRLQKHLELVMQGEQMGDAADVQYRLGQHYANGQGGDNDDREAEKWYTRAVWQGHAGALEALKDKNSSGRGI